MFAGGPPEWSRVVTASFRRAGRGGGWL